MSGLLFDRDGAPPAILATAARMTAHAAELRQGMNDYVRSQADSLLPRLRSLVTLVASAADTASTFWPGSVSVSPGSLTARADRPRLEVSSPQAAGRGPIRLVIDLANDAKASLVVFDAAGRKVAARAPERFSAGAHVLSWDPGITTAGVYFVRLQTDAGATVSQPCVVLR